MRFRRKPFRRRRRSSMMMLPLSICDDVNTWSAHPACAGVSTTMIPLSSALVGAESPGTFPADPNRPRIIVEQTERKSLLVKGIRFYWAVGVNSITPDVGYEVQHQVRCAIAKMEVDTAGFPTFIPDLWSELDRDLGSILWRGAGMLYQPSLSGNWNNNVGQAVPGSFAGEGAGWLGMVGNYSRPGSHTGPEVVKTSRRLGPNDGLFWCLSVKNNFTTEDNLTIETSTQLFGVAAVRSSLR